MPKNYRPEDAIQASIFEYLSKQLNGAIIHHSRNEGNRRGKAGIIDGARGKRLGVRAGYPDLVIHWQGVTFFIEVKAPKKYLGPKQKEVRDILEGQGFQYFLCRSVEDAQEAFQKVRAARRE